MAYVSPVMWKSMRFMFDEGFGGRPRTAAFRPAKIIVLFALRKRTGRNCSRRDEKRWLRVPNRPESDRRSKWIKIRGPIRPKSVLAIGAESNYNLWICFSRAERSREKLNGRDRSPSRDFFASAPLTFLRSRNMECDEEPIRAKRADSLSGGVYRDSPNKKLHRRMNCRLWSFVSP